MSLNNLTPIPARSPHADSLPCELYLEVTNYCNSRCLSCPLTYDHFLPAEPKHHLVWAEFRRIVDQLPQIDRAVLHGIGEPLLNPDLPRFIAHLKERGARVLFNTNAILLDEARANAVSAAGLDEIRVSLDAVTPDLYAQLRGVDKLPQVVRNLKAFVKRHGGRGRPRLSLWLVGLQANLHQVPDFVRLGAEIGVPEVYLQRLVYFGDGEGVVHTACRETSSLATRAQWMNSKTLDWRSSPWLYSIPLLANISQLEAVMRSAGAVRGCFHSGLRRPAKARVRQARVGGRAPRPRHCGLPPCVLRVRFSIRVVQ
jgi:MoaA/NifB/PqqE/SkfB family radical SAM enzyme